MKLLVGEKVLEKVSAYSMGIGDNIEGPILGMLFLTNYRLVFYAKNMHYMYQNILLHKLLIVHHLKLDQNFLSLEINTKTFLNFKIGFTFDVSNYKIFNELTSPALEAMYMMNTLMDQQQQQKQEKQKKMKNNKKHAHLSPGWASFDLDDEYRRLGLLKPIGSTGHDVLGSLAGSVSIPWRLTEVNNNFELCATYPTKFVVPRNVSDESLKRIASFRSKGRLPAVVYRHQ